MENNMWELMLSQNMTAKQLERLTGISDTHILRVADGQSVPTVITVYKIARALPSTIEEVFPDPYTK